MQDTGTLTSPAPLSPLALRDRIEALDVVRGFALIGICLMNLDFFNRSVLLVGTGLPPGLTGIDYAAAFFTGYFVTGKFWTIFSLLFGMGFAVMLTRAEQAGRPFMAPYLRRIAALAVFGALHHIFIWGGDILFSYAVAALFLLIALYGGWKFIVAMAVLFFGLSAMPELRPYAGPVVSTTVIVGLVALYLRNESRRFGMPAVSLVLLVLAILLAIADAVMWTMDLGPKMVRIPLAIGAALLLLLSWLSSRYHNPASLRTLRAGVAIWVLVFGSGTIGGAVQYFGSRAAPAPAAVQSAPVAAPAAGATADKAVAAKPAADSDAERKAARAKAEAERAKDIAHDTRVVSTGSYWEGVELRARQFLKRPPREAGFATILVAMFLIGTWFVRSGVMANTAAHLPLFRKLALYGIPLGVGLGLLGSLVATTRMPDDGGAFQMAFSMLLLGNLPASLGYASAVILMLHSASWMSKIRVLAPFGRMALTNYLMQSLICAVVFYDWGLGYFGMGRAAQLGFALGLCAVQIVMSHVWLQRYHYGLLEWVWRAVTYKTLPPLRRQPLPAGAQPA
ncbi:MAG TPA: DUF418 domain-containing protein [Telluria sp.]|nr:DUF418 domain-containing protein [Telluria sp.]